jgi:hypothetical protein
MEILRANNIQLFTAFSEESELNRELKGKHENSIEIPKMVEKSYVRFLGFLSLHLHIEPGAKTAIMGPKQKSNAKIYTRFSHGQPHAALLEPLKNSNFGEKFTKSLEKVHFWSSTPQFSRNLALEPIWVGHGCTRYFLIKTQKGQFYNYCIQAHETIAMTLDKGHTFMKHDPILPALSDFKG